jgi:hypothetical protein
VTNTQVISTVIGTTYVLGFFATSDNTYPNGITLSATGMSSPLEVNDITTSEALILYVECSTTFVATSATTTISLIGWDVPGWLFADDIYMYACQ